MTEIVLKQIQFVKCIFENTLLKFYYKILLKNLLDNWEKCNIMDCIKKNTFFCITTNTKEKAVRNTKDGFLGRKGVAI